MKEEDIQTGQPDEAGTLPQVKTTSRKRTRRAVKKVVQGRSFLSLEFFRQNAVFIIAATVMMLMLISNKYVCMTYMKELLDLQKDLNDAKTEYVDASTDYNSMIRESQMKAYVDTMHIDLTSPEQPPYILHEE